MKYMLLAYTNKAGWDSADMMSPEVQALCEFYEELGKELTATGELLTTEGLTHPSLARTVRPQDGGAVTLDGPFAESKEVLASYAVIECAGLDRAMSIAARCAVATGDTFEVRPIASGPEDAQTAR